MNKTNPFVDAVEEALMVSIRTEKVIVVTNEYKVFYVFQEDRLIALKRPDNLPQVIPITLEELLSYKVRKRFITGNGKETTICLIVECATMEHVYKYYNSIFGT